MKTANELKTFGLVLIVIRLIGLFLSPLILIWTLNTLFGLKIEYGFFEWLASLFLLGFFSNAGVIHQKIE